MHLTKITIVISKPSIIMQYFLNRTLHELCLHKDNQTSPLSADCILIAISCVGYIDQSGTGQFSDLCAYDRNEPGKKSQKPSLEVDFGLVTLVTHV